MKAALLLERFWARARWGLVAVVLLLGACTTHQTPSVISGQSDRDSAPDGHFDFDSVPDAIPRHEPRTIAGNKSPYTVLGKTYQVLPDSKGYVAQGVASWYGKKFHGRNTSNGEVYSLYGMTAAHKTLPIPSYVRVTNLKNGRQVVVRVNDRGPFHDDRIIDLTYVAAGKLGFLPQGTAPVRVEVIEPDASGGVYLAAGANGVTVGAVQEDAVTVGTASATRATPSVSAAPARSASVQAQALPQNTFLQAGAYSNQAAADSVREKLERLTSLPVQVVSPSRDQLYRVRVGPIADNVALVGLRAELERNRYPSHIVYD